MRKTFLLAAAFVIGAALLEAETLITVSPLAVVKPVSPYLFGYNATSYTGNYDSDTLLTAYCKILQPSAIRYPGGDASNMFFFNGIPTDVPKEVLTGMGKWIDYLDGTSDINWRLNLEQYYSFIKKVGAHGFLTINYPYARYGLSENPVSRAASLAAAWVRRDKGQTLYWEVGNETYACWEGGFKVDSLQSHQPVYISGKLYGEHFRVIADSMRQAAKKIGVQIKIGAVMADNPNIWDGSGKDVTKYWNEQLAAELKTKDNGCYADFISVHSYFLDGSEHTPLQFIRSSDAVVKTNKFIDSFFEKEGMKRVPLALTEWNISGDNGGRQGTQIAGLQGVCVLGRMMENHYVAACRFALKDYWRGKEGKGDFGLFANADPNKKPSTPYIPYYHFALMKRTLSGSLIKLQMDNDEGLMGFATKKSKTAIGLVIVNPNPESRSFELSIPAYKGKRGEFRWYELAPGDPSNEWCETIKINGVTPITMNFLKEIPARRAKFKEKTSFSVNGYTAMYVTITFR